VLQKRIQGMKKFEYKLTKYFSKLPRSFFRGFMVREKMLWRALQYCSNDMRLEKPKRKSLSMEDLKDKENQ